jgi:hypothetical protein
MFVATPEAVERIKSRFVFIPLRGICSLRQRVRKAKDYDRIDDITILYFCWKLVEALIFVGQNIFTSRRNNARTTSDRLFINLHRLSSLVLHRRKVFRKSDLLNNTQRENINLQ